MLQHAYPHAVRQLASMCNNLAHDEYNAHIFQMLLRMKEQSPPDRQRFWYSLLGQKLCKPAFQSLTMIGNKRMGRLLEWLRDGHTEAPRDLRHSRVTDSVQSALCDVKFQWAYDVLAEDLNSSDARPTAADVDPLVRDLRDGDEHDNFEPERITVDREWVVGPGATVAATSAEGSQIRWLEQMDLTDLYNIFVDKWYTEGGSDEVPTYVTATRCYNADWHKCLRFRHLVKQSKCDICEQRVVRASRLREFVQVTAACHLLVPPAPGCCRCQRQSCRLGCARG